MGIFSKTTKPKYCEKYLGGSLCVQASVKRSTSGLILKVSKVHSYEHGIQFAVSWTQLYTGKKYSDHSGKAWAVGQRTWGASVGGFPIGYTDKKKLTVNF